jgi:hypothetical protein
LADFTVIVTAAITGSIGLSAAGLQTRVTRRQIDAETERQHWAQVQTRRVDRREAYLDAINLINDWTWDETDPPRGYHVVQQFSKPFNHAAAAIRIYGSPEAIAAIDTVQTGLAKLNAARDAQLNATDDDGEAADQQLDAAWDLINSGRDALVNAARADVGPGPDDALRNTQFLRGGGPFA